MFAALEAPAERAIRAGVAEKRFRFLTQHPCVSSMYSFQFLKFRTRRVDCHPFNLHRF